MAVAERIELSDQTRCVAMIGERRRKARVASTDRLKADVAQPFLAAPPALVMPVPPTAVLLPPPLPRLEGFSAATGAAAVHAAGATAGLRFPASIRDTRRRGTRSGRQRQRGTGAGLRREYRHRRRAEPSCVRPTPAPTRARREPCGTRARASRLVNPGFTVVEGTLLPAVLRTSLVSTRGGLARAIISADVRSFDGSLVVIPRGSRLVGEYGTETTATQRRALVIWTRLIRPDGATIDLASPSADRLGRNGIKGDVNTHSLARFANAVLQTVLTVGTGIASRRSGTSVIIGVPGTISTTVSPLAQTADMPPMVTVDRGAEISVFVARDLDFSGVTGDK